MTLPNFLVIGAGKSGTTSIYHYVGQHPDVFMSPIKETNFFAYLAMEMDDEELAKLGWSSGFPVRCLEEYEELFEGVRDERAIGEASPRYLSAEGTAERIRRHLPHVRLIAVLRHPVERAYSSYLFHTRDGRETRSFESAIEDELRGTVPRGLAYGQSRYLYVGYYHRRLKPYFEMFPREQIAVFLFDDLRSDLLGLLRRFFVFLDVDPAFIPDVRTVYRVSGVQKSRLIRVLLRKRAIKTWVRRSLPESLQGRVDAGVEALRARNLRSAPMRDGARRRLTEFYGDDIRDLERLIDRDLSAWL